MRSLLAGVRSLVGGVPSRPTRSRLRRAPVATWFAARTGRGASGRFPEYGPTVVRPRMAVPPSAPARPPAPVVRPDRRPVRSWPLVGVLLLGLFATALAPAPRSSAWA